MAWQIVVHTEGRAEPIRLKATTKAQARSRAREIVSSGLEYQMAEVAVLVPPHLVGCIYVKPGHDDG